MMQYLPNWIRGGHRDGTSFKGADSVEVRIFDGVLALFSRRGLFVGGSCLLFSNDCGIHCLKEMKDE